MFKLIILILGLAIGFGGGVWWGQKNLEAAAQLSAEEERRILEAQIAIMQKVRQTLDQLQSKPAGGTSGSGFVAADQSGGVTAAEVNELKAETKEQEQELRRQLEKVK